MLDTEANCGLSVCRPTTCLLALALARRSISIAWTNKLGCGKQREDCSQRETNFLGAVYTSIHTGFNN